VERKGGTGLFLKRVMIFLRDDGGRGETPPSLIRFSMSAPVCRIYSCVKALSPGAFFEMYGDLEE